MFLKASMKCLYTDQDFRIMKYAWATAAYNKNLIMDGIHIEHKCIKHCLDTDDCAWKPFIFNPEYLHLRCEHCRKPIPEGLQAVFWFVKTESP